MSSEGKKFSTERLNNIRRMREARRLFKGWPLFALQWMQDKRPGYTLEQFTEDLRRRTPRKKRKYKSPLIQYGRYYRIDALMRRYKETGDYNLVVQAINLRSRITKPYRVFVKLNGECWDFTVSALISIERIEMLTEKFNACTTKEQVNQLWEKFSRQQSYTGN